MYGSQVWGKSIGVQFGYDCTYFLGLMGGALLRKNIGLFREASVVRFRDEPLCFLSSLPWST